MKRGAILTLFLFLFATVMQSADKQKCIILNSPLINKKILPSMESTLKNSGISVETHTVSASNINQMADSLMRVYSNKEVGILGLGVPGGIAAAKIVSGMSDPSYLVLISALGVSGEKYHDRLLMSSFYVLDGDGKNLLQLRPMIDSLISEQSTSSDDILQYKPEDILPSVKCPVFALSGVNDSSIDWFENLSNMHKLIPTVSESVFKAYPETGYMLQSIEKYMPILLIGSYCEEALPEANKQAIQDICTWITNLKKE